MRTVLRRSLQDTDSTINNDATGHAVETKPGWHDSGGTTTPNTEIVPAIRAEINHLEISRFVGPQTYIIQSNPPSNRIR